MQIKDTAKTTITLMAAVMMLSACSPAKSSTSLSEDETEEGAGEVAAAGYHSSDDEAGESGDDSNGMTEREPFDEDAAREAAEEQLASESYDGSYGCTQDCSGHEAGWRWRAENGYATAGNSNSFSEGGQAYDDALESRVDDMRSDYESGGDPDY